MNIRLIGIRESLLKNIIEELGSESIGYINSYVQDDILFFDISLTGHFSMFVVDSNMTICKDNLKIIINQHQFCKVVII